MHIKVPQSKSPLCLQLTLKWIIKKIRSLYTIITTVIITAYKKRENHKENVVKASTIWVKGTEELFVLVLQPA